MENSVKKDTLIMLGVICSPIIITMIIFLLVQSCSYIIDANYIYDDYEMYEKDKKQIEYDMNQFHGFENKRKVAL